MLQDYLMSDLKNREDENTLFLPENILPILNGIKEVIETASNNEKEVSLATLKANEKNEDIQFKKLKEQFDFRKSEQSFEQKKFYIIAGFFFFAFASCITFVLLDKPSAMEILKDLFLLISGGFGGYGIKSFSQKK